VGRLGSESQAGNVNEVELNEVCIMSEVRQRPALYLSRPGPKPKVDEEGYQKIMARSCLEVMMPVDLGSDCGSL